MDEEERTRRIAALVHAGLLASVGIYAVVLFLFRSELTGAPPEPRAGGPAALLFAAIGIAQFGAASWIGRRLLQSSRSGAGDRVRLYFLLRAAAAEAIGIYALILGLTGASAGSTAGLLVESVAALLVCAPTRPAWNRAGRLTQGHTPPAV